MGRDHEFAGGVGTQVVKVFDLAIAGTGLREQTTPDGAYTPYTEQVTVPDRQRYYPGAVDLTIRVCGRLVQLGVTG